MKGKTREKAGEKVKISAFKTVPTGEEKCIWMEAGVLDYKLCNNFYNCHTCAFDKAMKETAERNLLARVERIEAAGKKAKVVTWQESMRKRGGLDRKCRHYLTGRAPFRLCPYDFECHACEFDQMLEDGLEMQFPYAVVQMPMIEGYYVPEGHFFHLGHAWARVEQGGRVRIGLDDFSMRLFGTPEKVELPLTGEEVRFNGVGLAFKRMGNEASVLAPLSGIVSAVNAQAAKDPELVRHEPYNKGWLMVLEPTDMKKNLKELLFGKQTADWIRSEHQNLVEMVSEVGITFADGGQIEDVFGNVPNLSWEKLTRRFLRT
ncbi:MAG: glycine cleavage system protein H [Syntrophobacteraceae bacterium]|nr:glycine cleavage system protein H [Syntrophobacteraceae bacterium]